MPRDPETQRLVSSMGGNTTAARHDTTELTAKARAAAFQKFVDEVDEADPNLSDQERFRRAEHLMRAHLARIQLKAQQARKRKAAEREGVPTSGQTEPR
jgi:hypothetical protein